jgi:DNA-binding MarR family transcriptional regulator
MASTRTAGTEETGELAADEERITPEIRALADEVGRLYPAVFRRFHVSRRAVPGSDVTPRMLGALQHLAAAGPLTAGELVHHLRLSKAATTELVDRLEQRGLVARMHDERDRRRVFIWLTDEGQARASAHPRLLADDELIRALARMRPDDRVHLVDGLRALLAAADVPESASAEEQHP